MRLYIAGGIADYALQNEEAFKKAEDALEVRGFDTLNPWKNGLNGKPGIKGHQHMRADYLMILNGYTEEQDPGWSSLSGPADGVVVLPGGELSLGVAAEITFARSLHLAVLPYDHVVINAKEILRAWNEKHDH
jgi:hypothetical protein